MSPDQQAALALATQAFCNARKVLWLADDESFASGPPGQLAAQLSLLHGASRRFLLPFLATNSQSGVVESCGLRAGSLLELRGSRLYMQCSRPCRDAVWRWQHAGDSTCAACGEPAAPNVLGGAEQEWLGSRLQAQETDFVAWRGQGGSTLVVELGQLGFSPLFSPQLKALGRSLRAPVLRCAAAYDGPAPGGAINLRLPPSVFLDEIIVALRNTGLFPRQNRD